MANANDASHKHEKTITLNKLVPTDYRMWVVQAEATFGVHECLEIVRGTEPNPTPPINAHGNLPAINAALRIRINDWNYRHARAREALLRCLEPAEMIKVYSVKDSATAIWTRLYEEYGQVLDIEYIRADNQFHVLRKAPETSMNDHINQFTKNLQDVEYHKPPNATSKDKGTINLAFIASLGDDWSVFQQARHNTLKDMSTAELFAEVRAIDAGKPRPKPNPPETNPSDQAKALNSNFNNQHGGYRGNYRGRGGNRGGNRGGRGKKGSSRGVKKDRKSDFDPNKFCTVHQRQGHDAEHCRKAASDRKLEEGSNRPRESDRRYQPSFSRPYQMSAKVTRLIANNTELEPARIPHEWIVDSAANAYITSFRNTLYNYVEFTKTKNVKGFGGKKEKAYGQGSIILTDSKGYEEILEGVVYVPDSPDQILSLMKFRREHSADFKFTDLEEFILSTPTGFTLAGKSVNDILYTWVEPSTRIMAVQTRGESKKRKRSEAEEDDEENLDDAVSEKTPEPIRRQKRKQQTTPPSPLTSMPANLWHLRFGHASTTTLQKLKTIKSKFDSTKCRVCIRAKQTRKPFSPSNEKTKRKLERIHSDICGQYPESKGNSIYMLTFLDDFTHWCWAVAIPDKTSDTIRKAFHDLVKQVENETEFKIKYLRTDNGREYEGYLIPLLEEMGIKHETTTPYSSSSNGKAERLNRTLNEHVRAMLFQANMPKSFWAEAMATAAYVINRLPSSSIDNAIPYELWHNKTLDSKELKLLKPFGCLVNIHIPEQRRKPLSKVDTRSTFGCFIGYHTSVSHKIWDFERKCFVNSRNLIFEETEFPKASDFDEPPADSYDDSRMNPHIEQVAEQASRPIYDEIVVLPPPALEVFATYGPEFEQDNDPQSFTDAMRRPDRELWWEAFCTEIRAIIANKVWILTDLPPGFKALSLRWVCRTKFDANNVFEKYKARIVVKGYAQEAGLDFDKTFAPVVRIESVRAILAIAAANDLFILHVDCTNAFLNGESDLEIYVFQPEGFIDPIHPRKVLRLNKALYGLKQAPRIWYLLLCSVIVSLGFTVLETDTSIYVRGEIIIEVYVDDIKILGPTKEVCYEVYYELCKHFKMQNKGAVKSFLGLNITRNWREHSISINQPGYIDRLLARFNMVNAKTSKTPLEPGCQLLKATETDKLCDPTQYQELTGSLNHLAVFSRPDISFAVSKLSQFNATPTVTHWKAGLHVLRYLKLTRNYCITYRRSSIPTRVFGYADADYGSDPNDRISYTGSVFMSNGGPISWDSHKQSTVAHSTMESEYMALSDASREALARKQFSQELKVPSSSSPITILSDNQSALEIAENPANYRRAKHIDIRYHAIRHYLRNNLITVDYVPSNAQAADILTKALGPVKHHECVELLGLRNSYEQQK